MTSPTRGRDWSEAERGQIRHLEEFCAKMAHWGLECSHTDAGDPSCVIYDHWRQRVILHIARIDLQYVVALPRERRPAKKPTMPDAVEMALARLRAYEPRAG
jgi:hypothetical protein